MKELIRFQNVCCDCGNGHCLKDYNLTIFAGEIIYIQGISGSGKSVVEYILTGQAQVQSGHLYVNEALWTKKSEDLPQKVGIYSVGIQNPMAGKLSIVDNLMAIRRVPNVFSIYKKHEASEETKKMLEAFSIQRSPQTLVNQLTFLEEQLLSIGKAVLDGARLIILNCVSNIYSYQDAMEICRHMQRLSAQGVSFLVISEQVTPFQNIADKIQIIHHGIDLKEWHKTTSNKQHLYDYAVSMSNISSETSQHGKLLYILDDGWDSKYSLFTFLKIFKNNYPEVWDKYMAGWKPEENQYYYKSHVIIPQDSGERLPKTLTLEDNLALCIPKRAGYLGGCVINKRMLHVLANDFFRLIGYRSNLKYVSELGSVERKILSVYRWELTHPECIFLENPFWGLDISESMTLRAYFVLLQNKGVNLVIFSKNREEITGNEDLVVITSKKDTK